MLQLPSFTGLNRALKESISGLRANVIDKSIQRIGWSLGEVTKLEQVFDGQNGLSAKIQENM